MPYYLCFKVNKIPDLTMIKYSIYDISGQEDLIEKHSVFLRQLHRLGVASNVFFHLLYYYDGSKDIQRGKRLQVIFYATADEPQKLELIREFVTTSVLSTYYDFYCYEISSSLDVNISEGYLSFVNISGTRRRYKISSSISQDSYDDLRKQIEIDQYLYCSIQPGTNEVTEINSQSFFLDDIGRICCNDIFEYGAFLTKKDYHLYAQNRLYNDPSGVLIPIYSIMEWIPNELGRLYNVLKLMEGYNETAALRIDLFPVDIAEAFTDNMAPIVNELRQRMAQHDQGRDDNCDSIQKSIDALTKKLMKFPQFYANIIALADHRDIAVMLVDSVGAEAVESGSYHVRELSRDSETMDGFEIYSYDHTVIVDSKTKSDSNNYMSNYVSLYTLDEIRPMFSFPVLYPGENIECMKETDPEFQTGNNSDLYLGDSSNGYEVNFPVSLFKKHAFIAGVPGAGKTNTLLYMVSELWTKFHIPFLVLEPAKQEYRALAKASKLPGYELLKEVCIFSPGADTRFPLHINPFQFPIGLTLAEHIANLNAVFAGAFELPPPSPHFIDTCIEQVYIDKGWNINSRNDGKLEYPTMQELYDSLKVAVEHSNYQGETRGNLQSVLEVRVGSLLKREIGSVYNVKKSSFLPEEWLDRPVIIELEALGEGPANFMALLISTLLRETLKIRRTQNKTKTKHGINHVIFYEEAHNLVGPTQENIGDKVDPKVSATKFLVKMLAEVRALNEGIVIADQLPTVMAPEVLKNTGLKIGHRITASDDRELLGSTMSASADQLAEQSIYMPGEALVFYEGLQKPFKMRLAQWQNNQALHQFKKIMRLEGQAALWDDESSMYDSPTNEGLYQLIKDYPVYISLLHESKKIIVERLESSLKSQCERIGKLNTSFLSASFSKKDELVKKINMQKRHYTPNAENSVAVLSNIMKLEDQLRFSKSEYMISYKPAKASIQLIAKECCNLFLSNISVVTNYGADMEEMAAEIIKQYLGIFEEFEVLSFSDNELYLELLNNSNAALMIVNQLIAPDSQQRIINNPDTIKELAETMVAVDILCAAYEFGNAFENIKQTVDWQNQAVKADELVASLQEYADLYSKWMEKAQTYHDNQNRLKGFIIYFFSKVFGVFDIIENKTAISSAMCKVFVFVEEDIRKYVCWERNSSVGALAGTELYEETVKHCRNFAVIHIYDIYYQKAFGLTDGLLKTINDADELSADDIKTICHGYYEAYCNGFKICSQVGDHHLLAENITACYDLFVRFGFALKGEKSSLLREHFLPVYHDIESVYMKFYLVNRPELWRKVDRFIG